MFLLVESEIQEIFVCGIRKTGNFCLRDPQYGMFLLEESEIQEIFVCGIRIREIFICGIQNRGVGISNSSSRNPEPR